jgi:hypothetical protein
MIKLNLHSRVDLVMYAIRNGIVQVQLSAIELGSPEGRSGNGVSGPQLMSVVYGKTQLSQNRLAM